MRVHGEDLRYVHAWRDWLAWQEGRWWRDENGAVMRLAKAVVEEMFAEAARVNDEQRRTALRKFAIACQDLKRLTAMIKLAETEIEVVLAVSEIDADPFLLGVRNGVVDLREGVYRPARRDDYVTKSAGVAYDGEARCPYWIAFLEKIFADDAELIAYVRRVAGYALTGFTGEEVLFVFWGTGENGKSTFRKNSLASSATTRSAPTRACSSPQSGPAARRPTWHACTAAASSRSTRRSRTTTSTRRA